MEPLVTVWMFRKRLQLITLVPHVWGRPCSSQRAGISGHRLKQVLELLCPKTDISSEDILGQLLIRLSESGYFPRTACKLRISRPLLAAPNDKHRPASHSSICRCTPHHLPPTSSQHLAHISATRFSSTPASWLETTLRNSWSLDVCTTARPAYTPSALGHIALGIHIRD
jgi:hypothetical protein